MPTEEVKNSHRNYDPNILSKWLAWIVAVASAYLVAAFVVYVIYFGAEGFSPRQEQWGQFGDFFGGVVNPLMSFLALIAIVLTIILQSKQLELSKNELELSRQEVEATREEMTQSRKAAQEQVAHLKAEARKTDVYRTIQVLEARLESLYREPIYFLAGGILRQRELYFMLTFGSPEALSQIIPPDVSPPEEYETELVQTKSVLTQLHLTIVKLSLQLTFLIESSDSDPVLFFYDPTINHLASKLKKAGYLPHQDEMALKINAEMRQSIVEARNQQKGRNEVNGEGAGPFDI